MKRIIFFGSVMLFSMLVNAQPADKVWTLADCINYAYLNNIQVQQTQLNVLTSQLNLRQSNYNRLPNLTGSTSLTNNVGRSIDPFTNIVVDQDVTSQSYGLNSNVTLFNGMGQVNAVKQSRADLEKSEYDLQNQKNTTALSIANLYLNILLTTEQFKSAQLNLQTSQLQLERTSKMVAAGALPVQNELQAKQQVANDELLVIQAENSLELAKLALKQALQIAASEQFEIDVPELSDPDAQTLELDLDQVYTNSLQMPNIKSAEAQVESNQYRIQVAKASRYPTLSLFGGLRSSYSSAAPDQFPDPTSPSGFRENTYLNQLDFNFARFVQLSLNIPIFNRFQTNTNIGLAKINFENSNLTYKSTLNQHRQSIEQAYYDARAAAKTYDATRKQVEALGESYRNVEQRFELGATNAVEYNQIKNDFNRAQNDLIRAKYDFIFKIKVLDFYQGKSLQF